jgi:site-specific recombinase XerD
METQTITIDKGRSDKRLRKPMAIEVPAASDKVSLEIQRYLIESLSSRTPSLIPLALRNQSIRTLAEYLKFERSGSLNSPGHYIETIAKFATYAGMEPDDLIVECKTSDGLLNINALPKAGQRLDNYYKELKASNFAPHTVTQRIAYIKSWYKQNGVDVPFTRSLSAITVSHDRAPKPEELQKLLDMAELREKVIISMLALGGFREGTLCALKYRHAKEDLESGIVPLHIFVEAEIAKGKYCDFDTFVGREAVDYLKAYLELRRRGSPDGKVPPEKITDDSPLICKRSRRKGVKPMMPRSVYRCVHHIYFKAGLLTEKKHRRFNIRVHSIRKFFKTQLTALGTPGDYVEYFMGHKLSTYQDIAMKGTEFLRNIYAASGLSIRPKTQTSKIDALKEIVRAWGLNPEEILTKEALTRPYATVQGPVTTEEEQVKSLSVALKEMMKKELLDAKANH